MMSLLLALLETVVDIGVVLRTLDYVNPLKENNKYIVREDNVTRNWIKTEKNVPSG